jgi:acetolactate synthase regulatory subunit
MNYDVNVNVGTHQTALRRALKLHRNRNYVLEANYRTSL